MYLQCIAIYLSSTSGAPLSSRTHTNARTLTGSTFGIYSRLYHDCKQNKSLFTV